MKWLQKKKPQTNAIVSVAAATAGVIIISLLLFKLIADNQSRIDY